MRYAVISHGGMWFWTNSVTEALVLKGRHKGVIVDYRPGPRAGEGTIRP